MLLEHFLLISHFQVLNSLEIILREHLYSVIKINFHAKSFSVTLLTILECLLLFQSTCVSDTGISVSWGGEYYHQFANIYFKNSLVFHEHT